ncbi:MAG: ABC transporter permease [Turicibacter sp.]|nr:ABC transporter permease [Turicibacter sp.]
MFKKFSYLIFGICFLATAIFIHTSILEDEVKSETVFKEVDLGNSARYLAIIRRLSDENENLVNLEKTQLVEVGNLQDVLGMEQIYSPNYPVWINDDFYEIFDLTGVGLTEFSFLLNNSVKIQRGRTFSAEELTVEGTQIPALIPSEVATELNLDIGSQIEISYDKLESKYILEVIGIFDHSEENGTLSISPLTLSSSSIIVPNRFIETSILEPMMELSNPNEAEKEQAMSPRLENTVFVLSHDTNVEDFQKEANAILAPTHEVLILKLPK